MAIIGNVEKKNWKVKLLGVCIHLLLILGAATMIYPLLLMLSGSVKSDVDFPNFTIYPQYISQDLELFKKFLMTRYNDTISVALTAYKEPRSTLNSVKLPEHYSKEQVKDFEDFLQFMRKTKPEYWYNMAMISERGVDPWNLRNFREWIQSQPRYRNKEEGLAQLNQDMETSYAGWNEIFLLREDFTYRNARVSRDSKFSQLVRAFKEEKCTDELMVYWSDLEGRFINLIRSSVNVNLPEINKKLGTHYNSWEEIDFPETCPKGAAELADIWAIHVKSRTNPVNLILNSKSGTPAWRLFLLRKYGSFKNLITMYGGSKVWKYMDDIELPATVPSAGQLRADWMEFLAAHSTVKKLWIPFIKQKYGTPAKLNAAWGTKYKSIDKSPDLDGYGPLPADFPKVALADYRELQNDLADKRKSELSPDFIKLDTLAIHYRKWLKTKYKTIEAVNQAYSYGVKTFADCKLPDVSPGEENLQKAADWKEFVLMSLKPEEMALSRLASVDYKNELLALYTKKDGTVDYKTLSKDYGKTVTGVNDTPSYNVYPGNKYHYTDKAREDYLRLIKSGMFNSMLRVAEPEKYQKRWEQFLAKKYGTTDSLNKAWHLCHSDFAQMSVPYKMHDWYLMQKNRPALVKEYLKRNYLMVFDTLFTNGNAAVNTLIYCLLAVAAALLVNPLCAYGLSRYKPASSYKILLFLLLPMAFPGMVLAIPQFLMIKQMGILNTFACLILPGMASGYNIFLLKGFFDSLPKELFESAAIDGANEWTVFWNIGMSLSTPILSVIALGAFTTAYANFMLAFLLCQKQSMWTMMVYLYQLQQRASSAVGFAALIIAAIPTLLVFVFCQNIIIKGIVVPTEK